MSDLVFIAFDSEQKAEAVREKVLGMQKEYLIDVGINDQFMTDAASALRPGTGGLFLLIRKMTTDKVLKDLAGIGGTVMRTSFDETKEAALREALAGRAAAEATTAPPA